jgi:uncharacterized membrane protein YhaH (DUF805 family)
MTLTWCVNGENLSFDDEAGVTCVVNSVIMPLPALFLGTIFLYRLRQVAPFRTFTQLDRITRRHYQILMLSLFALIVLIPLYAFTEMELCGSLIFSVVLQVIGYLLAGILVTKECYRLTHWPGWAIKLFLCLCLVTLIVSAVTYSSHLSAPAAIVVVCGQFVILCIANMTAWLKDYLLGPDDLSKL